MTSHICYACDIISFARFMEERIEWGHNRMRRQMFDESVDIDDVDKNDDVDE